MSGYDFDDKKIRRMAERHDPRQDFHTDGTPVSDPTCDTCGQAWPCLTIEALRAWYRKSGLPTP